MKKSCVFGLAIYALSVNSAVIPDDLRGDTNIINGVAVQSHTQDDWNDEQSKAEFYRQRDQANLRTDTVGLPLGPTQNVPLSVPKPTLAPSTVLPTQSISSKTTIVNIRPNNQEIIRPQPKQEVRPAPKVENLNSQTTKTTDRVWDQDAKEKNFGNASNKKPEWTSNSQRSQNSQAKTSQRNVLIQDRSSSSQSSLVSGNSQTSQTSADQNVYQVPVKQSQPTKPSKIKPNGVVTQSYSQDISNYIPPGSKPISVKYLVYEGGYKPKDKYKNDEPKSAVVQVKQSVTVQNPVQSATKVSVISTQSSVVNPPPQVVVLSSTQTSYAGSSAYNDPVRSQDSRPQTVRIESEPRRQEVVLLPQPNLRSSISTQNIVQPYGSVSEARQNIISEINFREQQGRTSSIGGQYYRT